MSRVLIVEDDQDLSTAYRLILQRAGHEVETASNGDIALQKLGAFSPDLILLDLLMPVKSGVEFLTEYNRTKHHPSARIVVFTNFESGPEINEALRLGADKCVIKAWTAPDGLVHVVDELLVAKA